MCNNISEMRELDSRWSKARKEHACCACEEAIRAGDAYHVTTLLYDRGCKYDRYVETAKHCARCYTMIEALWKRGVKVVDLKLDCGELWETPPEEIASLAFWRPGDATPQPSVAGSSPG